MFGALRKSAERLQCSVTKFSEIKANAQTHLPGTEDFAEKVQLNCNILKVQSDTSHNIVRDVKMAMHQPTKTGFFGNLATTQLSLFLQFAGDTFCP